MPKRSPPLRSIEEALAWFDKSYEVDEDGCWIWTAASVRIVSSSGRAIVIPKINWPTQCRTSAHRFSWMIHFTAPLPPNVWRRCRKDLCVNPNHLKRSSNIECYRTKARIDWETAQAVRRFAEDGLDNREIARRVGIGRSSVSQIINGKSWTRPI